jgi:hypothetical protein
MASPPPVTLTRSQTESWTTITEDLVTSVLSLWLIAGLFVDGWAHRNLEELETFFTPWHALFYSGFVVTAAWMAYLVRKHSRIPVGYRPGLVGVGVFAIGGVGDFIWHSIFGIESSLDALLSPTHLLLLTGILLILTSPIRSSWHRPTARATPWGQILPALLSTTLVVAVLQFFFLYASGWTSGIPGVPYDSGQDELLASYGVLEIMISTAILFGGALALLKRYRPPPGSFLLLFGVIGVLMSALDEFAWPWEILQMLIAGAVADVLVVAIDPDPGAPNRFRIFGLLAPIAVWSIRFIAFAVFRPSLGWPPEIWGGSIVFAGLLGWGLAILMTLAPSPAKA